MFSKTFSQYFLQAAGLVNLTCTFEKHVMPTPPLPTHIVKQIRHKALPHNCFRPPSLLAESLLLTGATLSSFYLLVELGLQIHTHIFNQCFFLQHLNSCWDPLSETHPSSYKKNTRCLQNWTSLKKNHKYFFRNASNQYLLNFIDNRWQIIDE